MYQKERRERRLINSCLITLFLVFSTCALYAETPEAPDPSPEVTVTTTSDSNNHSTTFTVHVKNLPEGKKWKDLHLYSGDRKFASRTRNSVKITGQGGQEQSWRVKGHHHHQLDIFTGTSQKGFGNGTYTFTIGWSKKPGKPEACKWVATDDGAENVRKGHVIDEGRNKAKVVDIPVVAAILNSGEPIEVPIADLTYFSAQAIEFDGYEYEIYHSLSLNPGFEDELGIGINAIEDPVPVDWGLEFLDFVGVLGPDGVSEFEPAIEAMEDDGDLIGQTFFLVFTVKDGSEIVLSSDPVMVTILDAQ